jgi:hypothetical protein
LSNVAVRVKHAINIRSPLVTRTKNIGKAYQQAGDSLGWLLTSLSIVVR